MSDVINAHDLGVAGGYIIEAAMQGDIDQLKAENAELRNDADLLRAMLSQVQTEKRCYMAENAKLRELVRDLWDFYCVMPDEQHVFKEELDFSAEVWKRIRELGVEVDG